MIIREPPRRQPGRYPLPRMAESHQGDEDRVQPANRKSAQPRTTQLDDLRAPADAADPAACRAESAVTVWVLGVLPWRSRCVEDSTLGRLAAGQG